MNTARHKFDGGAQPTAEGDERSLGRALFGHAIWLLATILVLVLLQSDWARRLLEQVDNL